MKEIKLVDEIDHFYLGFSERLTDQVIFTDELLFKSTTAFYEFLLHNRKTRVRFPLCQRAELVIEKIVL